MPKSRSRTCAKPIVEEERTDVNATQKQGLRGSMGVSNGKLGGKSEEDQERVALLNTPGTGNNLRSRHTRASEEDTVMTITAVDPRNERRKMNTSSPQHRRPVNRVEGDVDRNCNLVHIRTVTVKPLTCRMNDRLASVRCLDPKLKKLQKNTSALRDKFNSDLARETADDLADRDGPKSAIGLTKGHDGGTSPRRRMLTTSESSHRTMSDEAGRKASRT